MKMNNTTLAAPTVSGMDGFELGQLIVLSTMLLACLVGKLFLQI